MLALSALINLTFAAVLAFGFARFPALDPTERLSLLIWAMLALLFLVATLHAAVGSRLAARRERRALAEARARLAPIG